MQNVGGTWLMTSLSSSALLIALMQAATSLPVFLVGILAGAVADIIDRRKMLLVTQWWMLLAAALLGILTWKGLTTPASLLALTFLLGLGNAMNAPVWQAIIPEIVGHNELAPAVALNGVGFNIARAIGPALGGLCVALMGVESVFILNAISFIAVILVIKNWKRAVPERTLPAEHLVGAIRAGLRYVRHSPELHRIFYRSGAFIFFASGLWALLPVVAKERLKLGADGYGLLLGCLGAGCLVGAALLPTTKRRFKVDVQITLASTLFGIATLILAFSNILPLLCLAMGAAGVAWLNFMSSMNVATQSAVPSWVQARAIAFYLLIVQGGLALGSTFWGFIAGQFNTHWALGAGGIGLLFGVVTRRIWPLAVINFEDLAPSVHWPEPEVIVLPEPEDGPVLVTVEYHVHPNQTTDFKRTMRQIRKIRLRDGAIRWELYQDLGNPNLYIENFTVESWGEHVRQHHRMTKGDREVQARLNKLLEKTSRVSHLVYAYTAKKRQFWLKKT